MRKHRLPNRYRKYKVLRIFGALVLCIFSWRGFVREYAGATILYQQDYGMVLVLRRFDPAWLTNSVRGLDDLMQKCADALLTNEAVRLSPQLQDEIGTACSQAAGGILVRNPGFSRAHAVGLIAAPGVVSGQAYALAAEAAPFEPWPLRVRLLSAERALVKHSGALSADLMVPVFGDVARAMQSDWGRELVAGLYIRRTGLRALIEAAAKTRSEGEQRDFLRATRDLAAQIG